MLRPLLIPLTYFCLQTWLEISQAKCQMELSMMDDAFDDQYIGCTKEMDTKARKLLQDEMSPFSTVWQRATEKWKEVKTNKAAGAINKDEYGIALVAYTDSPQDNNEAFSTKFKEAVREAGKSRAHYMASFQFKAFHYYLTRALQLLRGRCDVINKIDVYRGDPDCFNYKKGNIRFGHFASSSTNKSEAEKFMTKNSREQGTLFTIHTCFGVKIWDMSYHPDQKEVLIPVHEIFRVVERKGNNFTLRSTNQACSHFNCVYLDGEKNQTCVNNSATRGAMTFPGVLSPSLFGGSVILVHVAALELFAGF